MVTNVRSKIFSPCCKDCPPVNVADTKGLPRHPDVTTLPTQRTTLPQSDEESELKQGPTGIGGQEGIRKNRLLAPTARKNASRLYLSDADLLPHDQLLRPDYAPNIIHMVWCGRRWFEFHHYINVISLIRELHPDEIDFYYDEYPVQDYWLYNTWIDELKTEYPFFRPIQINPKTYGPGCNTHGKPNREYVLHLLTYYGGIYINEHTLVTKFPMKFRSYDLIDALDPVTGHGFMLAKRNLPVDSKLQAIKLNKSYSTMEITCIHRNDYNTLKKDPTCIISDQVYYPKDIWDLDTTWGGLIRRIFYGSTTIPVPKQDYTELIPNIAHIVWIGGGEMDFLFYLCVLSLLYVQEVDTLYIHGNAPPSGPLWEKIKDHPKIKLIHRYTTMQVYGTDINVLSHVTDVWRVDFMIKYGGKLRFYIFTTFHEKNNI